MKSMAIKISLPFIGIIISSVSLFAADFYVDIKSETAEKNGTAETPFTTLRQAVDAANILVGEASTIYVRGGEDRVYAIEGANDLSTVTVSNLTITAWEGYEKPLIDVSRNLSTVVANPNVIDIAIGADFCTITDIDFKYYNTQNNNAGNKEGCSLGGSGAIISVGGNNVYIYNCSFEQEGNGGISEWGANAGCIKSKAEQNKRTYGIRLVVKNCFFKHNYQQAEGAIRVSDSSRIIGCTFEDCKRLFMTVKNSGDVHFMSNRVVNSAATIDTEKEGWYAMANTVIAFNIFVGPNNRFLEKGSDGMSGAQKIYNNTFVGGKDFISVSSNNRAPNWAPQIFNNLIVCTNADAVVIKEDQALFPEGKLTSFVDVVDNKTGAVLASPIFRNNAYYASALNGGAAQNVEGYEFVLPQEDNIVLQSVPEFLSLDPQSPDFCRVKLSKNPIFAGKGLSWRDDGKYPDYIGAVEPNRAKGFFIILK